MRPRNKKEKEKKRKKKKGNKNFQYHGQRQDSSCANVRHKKMFD